MAMSPVDLFLSTAHNPGTSVPTKLFPKNIFIYPATPHPVCSMKRHFSAISTSRDREAWLMEAIKQVGKLVPVPLPYMEVEDLLNVEE